MSNHNIVFYGLTKNIFNNNNDFNIQKLLSSNTYYTCSSLYEPVSFNSDK